MLGFLHTLAANAESFGALLESLDPGIPARHLVDEAVLVEARSAGAQSEGVRRQVQADVASLVREGARVVVCTCSTIGAAAEATTVPAGTVVMRIDRPMAERAVACGPALLVVASLKSTFDPTVALLVEAAAGKALEISKLLCHEAWEHYERGDLGRYAQAIARTIGAFRGRVDAIVLAQASMAPAADLLPNLYTPVLSSPRLGLEAALQKHHLATSARVPGGQRR
jgi:hypothetical protein